MKAFSRRRAGLAALAILAVLAAPRGDGADEPEYIQYDFSHPDEVFKATMKETVVGKGLDPAVLYQLLRTGQMVIVNDHPNNPEIPWLTTEGILVNAPPAQVFEMIEQIEKYNQFVPEVDNSRREKVTDDVDQVFYELGIQILFIKVKIPYSVYHYNRPPNRVDWTLAGGEFNVNIGAYEVVGIPGEPERSMLFYTSYALARNPVVETFYNRIPMLDMMINLSAGTVLVKAMKERAESLHAANGGSTAAPSGPKPCFTTLMREYPDTLALLAGRGKVVMIEDTDPVYYTGGVVVDRSQEEAYASVADLEGMASIAKQVETTVLERGENTARVKIRTVIPLMIDFDSEYVLDYKFEPPRRFSWTQEPGGDIEGVAGSWELIGLPGDKTLAFYRNTSDLASQGVMMRQLLKVQPSFELAIQASQTMYMVSDMKKYSEASPEERNRMAEEAQKK